MRAVRRCECGDPHVRAIDRGSDLGICWEVWVEGKAIPAFYCPNCGRELLVLNGEPIAKGSWFLVACYSPDGEFLTWDNDTGWGTHEYPYITQERPYRIPIGGFVIEVPPPPNKE